MGGIERRGAPLTETAAYDGARVLSILRKEETNPC